MERYKEFRDNIIGDSVKTLPLGGSIYEHSFWTLYHEDCPKVVKEAIQRSCFAMVVTALLTKYILGSRMTAVGETFFYGSYQLNMVRMICILMLHLQMQPKVYSCRNMLQFAINNAEQFTGQSATFPIFLAMFKLVIVLGIEMGNLTLLMYYDNEWSCIIFYVSLAVVAGLEGKMMNIVRTSNTNTNSKPLTYLANSSSGALVQFKRYMRKYYEGTIDSGLVQVFLVAIFSVLDAILALFYHTIYYYVMVYAPLFVIFYSRLYDSFKYHL